MNKKISLGVAISLVAIGCAITFVLTWAVSLNMYNSKIGTAEKYEGMYAKLREIDAAVRNNYIGTLNEDKIENSVIDGYVVGLDDRYASYMSSSSYYEIQQANEGVILGAGFEVEDDGSGYLKITSVYKGSSAELNGILAGDIITEIDGKNLLSMEKGTAEERLSGEVGTRIALKLLRDGEEVSVNLIRQQLEIESVTGELLENNAAYIRITTFNAKTAEQFANQLNTLTEAGASTLIIDVRQNSGGLVSALKPILNRFIPAATVATAEYADGSRKSLLETDSDTKFSMPMAILVDGGTASAAELFAGALRDECGAVLVGTQTYGKALMQNTYEFSDGSALTISTAKVYLTRSGTWDETGLKPDYLAEQNVDISFENLTFESDTQLQKAIEVITATTGNSAA
ncbi:MAG: PDZ domain-containing protein [Oscillospiraceae bacterium]|nr:PDZ domain-containing protein [Oscillospiraceae bacterium]